MLQQTSVAEGAYLSCNLSLSTKRQFPHSVLQPFLKALMTILLILFPPFLRRNKMLQSLLGLTGLPNILYSDVIKART